MRSGYYFGAGPAALPTTVVEQAAAEFVSYGDLGVGVAEMSHRSAQATDILNATKAQIREILSVPDTHEIEFLQGGGSGGFAAALYALAAYKYAKSQSAKLVGDYIVTGTWSAKALAEAQRLGFESNIIAKPEKYTTIPELSSSRGDFVYYCDNETVHGVEFPGLATTPPIEKDLVVCDISSNMLSRPIDVSKFAILFGGVQKNVSAPGIALFIVRKDILEAQQTVPPAELLKAAIPVAPSFIDLGLQAKNNSAYNTLPVFVVEVTKLVTAHLLDKGGIDRQAKEAAQKAIKLYDAVDRRPELYRSPVEPAVRSRMNIVFTLPTADDEARFLKEAASRGLTGLKGHRSVGGIRISNYNSITMDAVDALVELMDEFN